MLLKLAFTLSCSHRPAYSAASARLEFFSSLILSFYCLYSKGIILEDLGCGMLLQLPHEAHSNYLVVDHVAHSKFEVTMLVWATALGNFFFF